MDKAKPQFYYVMSSLYYGMKVEYASLIWDEFTTSIKHKKKTTDIANAHFWGLILHET